MNKSKIIFPVLLGIALASFGFYGLSWAANENGNPMSQLAQKLAQKFNLNQDEVTKFLDEEQTAMHEARQKENQARLEEKLNQLVKDGKLTEDQKNKLLAKHEELKKKHEEERQSMINLSQEERQTKMEEKKAEREKERQELEQWAKDNGIDVNLLPFRMGMGQKGKGDMGMGREMGNCPFAGETTATDTK